MVSDQRPHDIDETPGECDERVNVGSFLAPFALVELPGWPVALRAVECCHVEHLAQTSVVALWSAQSAVAVA